MATSNFQTQKSFCFLLCLSFTFFLLLLNKVNSTETASFSFPSFEPNQPTLIFQNDSSVTSSGKLQLTKLVNDTPVAFRLGRALYSAPIHIWDRTTGKVASFVTSFSFVINVPKDAKSGAGMSFFLGPVNSQPRRVGPFFGLFDDENSDPSYQTVAVEFDTGTNPWDPEGYHIGIDVNCIRSIKTVSWDWANGQVANVVIRYEASTKSLTASLVYPSVGTGTLVTATVDLKDVLPEWVSVGISASTGWDKNHFETHDLLSWSFESKLADGKCNALEDNAHLSSYELHDSI